MSICRRSSLVLAFMLGASTLSPVAAQAAGSTAPTVAITSPVEGATATDQLTITAVALIDSTDGDSGNFMA